MKKVNPIILLMLAICVAIFNQSCEEEIVVLTLQDRLANETPLDIHKSGIPVEDLYGLEYGGGYIFYLDPSDGSGLIAAKSNLPNANWGCAGTDIDDLPNVTEAPQNPETVSGARLGDGMANTTSIVAQCGDGDYAAKACTNYTIANTDDWYLPSRSELELMYFNLWLTEKVSFSLVDFYASSTEYDENKAWVLSFEGGNRLALSKFFDNNGYHVRPVRSF